MSHVEPDASTVVLRLTQPDADFLGASLGERYNVMVPREIKEQFGDFKTAAVGTGPYMLKDFKPDTHTILERNPNWREQGADGKPLPYIDGVQVIGFGDYSAQVAAMRAGQLELNNVQGFLKLESDALKQTNPKLIPYADQTACPWGLQLMTTPTMGSCTGVSRGAGAPRLLSSPRRSHCPQVRAQLDRGDNRTPQGRRAARPLLRRRGP